MDEREKDSLRSEIRRWRSKQADLKSMMSGLDPQKDKRRADELINQIAGLEGQIADAERRVGRG